MNANIVALALTFAATAAAMPAAERAGPVRWLYRSSSCGDLPQPGGGTEQTACLAVDFDGDGTSDVVLTERSQAPAMIGVRNGAAGWTRYVLEAGPLRIAAGGTACDVDGDGDLDLIFGAAAPGSEIWWWENPAPDFALERPWRRRAIKTEGKGMHHDQLAGDFLGEGRSQIVSWFQGGNALLLFSLPQDPHNTSPWPSITVAVDLRGEGLACADIDGDGRPDLLGGGRWFKHLGGTKFAAHVIDESQTAGRIAAGDLVEGGRPEVVMVLGDGVGPLKWYQCEGDPTKAASWTGHDLLGRDVNHGHSLQLADLNGDGHLDIFCAEMSRWDRRQGSENPDSTAWIFYGDGKGNFTTDVLARGVGFHEAKIADLDGDGRLDIVSKPFAAPAPRVDMWFNQGF